MVLKLIMVDFKTYFLAVLFFGSCALAPNFNVAGGPPNAWAASLTIIAALVISLCCILVWAFNRTLNRFHVSFFLAAIACGGSLVNQAYRQSDEWFARRQADLCYGLQCELGRHLADTSIKLDRRQRLARAIPVAASASSLLESAAGVLDLPLFHTEMGELSSCSYGVDSGKLSCSIHGTVKKTGVYPAAVEPRCVGPVVIPADVLGFPTNNRERVR